MEIKLGCSLENMTSLFSMGLWVRRGNEEVIHVDDKPSLSDHVSERVIHELLECSGGITETEEHNCQFKESFVCNEGGLPLVTVFDLNIVVPPTNIKLGEVRASFSLSMRSEMRGRG